ncbi:HMG-box, partial [Martensiomyces pterosporus]
NEILAIKLLRSQKRLRRMKIERNLLLERFERTRQYNNDSASDSDVPLKDTFPRPPISDPRSEKDPNAPKRPANAFVLFCQAERPNIKSAGTELSSSELTKAMGVKWKNLPSPEKQKYYDLYEREMSRYQQELVSYK